MASVVSVSSPAQAAPEPSSPLAPTLQAAPRQGQLSLEARLLQQALAKLRGAHDARGALLALDEYRVRFPAGQLSLEADTARVDALLMLAKRAEALALLTALPVERLGRRRELQLLRAELTAERDCARALGDFDAVLASGGTDGLNERALYGRAACRFRAGSRQGALNDLRNYAERYPEGRFRAQVAATLASTESKR